MPAKPNDDLFQLVQSLSTAEKGYFRKQAVVFLQGERSKYLKIFDALLRMPVYDESAIKATLDDEALVRHFSRVKNYLFDAILRSLIWFEIEKAPASMIDKLLMQSRVLRRRGLFRQGIRLLDKALASARHYEHHVQACQIIREKISTCMTRYGHNEAASHQLVRELKQSEQDALEYYLNEKEFEDLYFEVLFYKEQIGVARSYDDLRRIDAYSHHPLLSSVGNAKTVRAGSLYYAIRQICASLQQNLEALAGYALRHVELCEAHPHILMEASDRFASALSDCIGAGIHLTNQDLVEAALFKLKDLKGTNEQETLQARANHCLYRLSWYNRTGQVLQGQQVLSESQAFFAGAREKLPPLQHIYLSYAMCYLQILQDDYAGASHTLQDILAGIDKKGSRQDLFCMVHILNMLIHYELGNGELLPYTLKSATNFINKRRRVFRFEKAMLQFIRLLPDIPSRQQFVGQARLLRTTLDSLRHDPLEMTAFRYFDFISWLDSKIEARPFVTIVQERAGLSSAEANRVPGLRQESSPSR